MRFRKRQLRWLRAKAWRIARTQWLMSFPLVALIAAGAGALGAFDAGDKRPQRVDLASFIPTPIPYATPANFIPTDPLLVTFILVSTEEEQAVLQAFENGLIWREVLQHGTFEVLVITNEEQEAAAFRRIERARNAGRESGFIVQVDDRRAP
jgi:hypothetical protein